MRYTALIVCLVLTGCGTPATTKVDPAESHVKSKTVEKRAATTEKVTITTAPATYKLRINQCLPSPSSPVSQPLPNPSVQKKQQTN